MSESRVAVAVVTGAHGVKGRVRLKTFTDEPVDVAAYGPLTDADGDRSFRVTVTGGAKEGVVAELSGVRDRDAALALKGTVLHADRSALPSLDDDEDFYHADLIGLAAETAEGQRIGKVRGIFDFGAGDVLDIKPAKGRAVMLPFTREAVPEIDLEGGRLVVVLPDEIEVIDTGEADADPAGEADDTE